VNARREADANLRAAQAAPQTAKLNLGYTQVARRSRARGPLEVTVGNLVAGAGAPVLTTLVSVDPMYASFADEQIVAQALQSACRAQRALIEPFPCRWGGHQRHALCRPAATRWTTRSMARAARCACAPCSATWTAR
jgi:multidrug efflux system membrane fusion protein